MRMTNFQACLTSTDKHFELPSYTPMCNAVEVLSGSEMYLVQKCGNENDMRTKEYRLLQMMMISGMKHCRMS